MDLAGWEARYRADDAKVEIECSPSPLVVATASALHPGRALDLACGTGRNTLWLAQRGWSVTAVDGSAAAIETLRRRALQLDLTVDTRITDLEKPFSVEPAHWDLIAMCYYLQRDLFEPCKRGVAPGGWMIAIALLVEPGKENSPFRLRPGELRGYFQGWEIVHDREGRDAWEHTVAEIAARRPSR
jgi:tellurite methyltransferase